MPASLHRTRGIIIYPVSFRVPSIYLYFDTCIAGIQDYKTWLKATETCQNQNKMLDPMDESIFPNLTHDLTMWTPDYVLNLGCEPKGTCSCSFSHFFS